MSFATQYHRKCGTPVGVILYNYNVAVINLSTSDVVTSCPGCGESVAPWFIDGSCLCNEQPDVEMNPCGKCSCNGNDIAILPKVDAHAAIQSISYYAECPDCGHRGPLARNIVAAAQRWNEINMKE